MSQANSKDAVAPEVSVVVISHEHAHDLPDCLRSLGEAMAELDAELIYIDNRSADRSFEIAEQMAPEPRTLIRNGRRKGFSANANEGIRRSSADAILLLNPDTVVERSAITELLAHLKAFPGAGIVAPALYSPDGSLQPSRRRFPTLRSAVSRRTPLRRWLLKGRWNSTHLMLDEPADRPHRIDWALAACWLINREALEDVGLFDEGYRLYVEDIDLCLRMRQSGWEVIFVPAARVTHRHHAVTDTRWATWRTLAHYRGMLRFIRKHGLRPG